jgi:hypothetical protein
MRRESRPVMYFWDACTFSVPATAEHNPLCVEFLQCFLHEAISHSTIRTWALFDKKRKSVINALQLVPRASWKTWNAHRSAAMRTGTLLSLRQSATPGPTMATIPSTFTLATALTLRKARLRTSLESSVNNMLKTGSNSVVDEGTELSFLW